MMWYLQLVIEWASMMLAQDVVLNAIFACLALGSAFRPSQRVCAVLTVLVYLVLMMT